MKNGPHSKRPRGRTRRNNNNGNANRHYDSNGPDVRIRGTASQIFDKYQSLARDASSSGDRVMAEGYLQHAEHYFRIMQANNSANGRVNALPGDPMFEQMMARQAEAAEEAAEEAEDTEETAADGTQHTGDAVSATPEDGAEQPRQERRPRGRPRGRRPRQEANTAEGQSSGETPETAPAESVVETPSADATPETSGDPHTEAA